jgi:hypothetical protein
MEADMARKSWRNLAAARLAWLVAILMVAWGAPVAAAHAAMVSHFGSSPLLDRRPRVCPAGGAACAGSTSQNWSGYAKTGGPGAFRSISSTWWVPNVSHSVLATYSTAWVGIDGDGNCTNCHIQAGTEQDSLAGITTYYAWWEILPANETVMFSVSPGDNIVASIEKQPTGKWVIYLADRNSNQSFTKTLSYGGPQSTAEFIQERTYVGGHYGTLANYHPFSFTNARINGVSPALTLNDSIAMLQGGSQVSTPSAPNEAGNAFTMAYGSTAPAAPPTPLFQRQGSPTGGSVWYATGVPCTPTTCFGWTQVDNDPQLASIAAGAGSVFKIRKDHSIWEWTGNRCTAVCGEIKLDNNPGTAQIAAGSGSLWQLHTDGTIWRSTGVPCLSSTSCPGWAEMDNNPVTTFIAAGAGTIFQLHNDGSVWRSNGTPCTAGSCLGWVKLDNNPATTAVSANANTVFQLHSNGTIWRSTGTPCTGNSCPGWVELGDNPTTSALSAGGNNLYQLQSGGNIWRSTGAPCTGLLCLGWDVLDKNPASTAIAASSGTVYQLHNDGSIWRSNGNPCTGNSCLGWVRLGNNNPLIAQIAVSNGS